MIRSQYPLAPACSLVGILLWPALAAATELPPPAQASPAQRPEEAAAEIGTVEGLTTAPVLRDLSHRLGIELPITEGVCQVLDGTEINELASRLMGRQPTRE